MSKRQKEIDIFSNKELTQDEINKQIIELHYNLPDYIFNNRFRTYSVHKEDMMQEGYIAMMEAASKYDLNNAKGATFWSYASFWVFKYMYEYANNITQCTEIITESIEHSLYIAEEEQTQQIKFKDDIIANYFSDEQKEFNLQLWFEVAVLGHSVNATANKYNTYRARVTQLVDGGEKDFLQTTKDFIIATYGIDTELTDLIYLEGDSDDN